MKFSLQTLGPDVIDSRSQVQNRPIALTNHAKRLQHIIQNSSFRQRAGQFAADCIKPAVYSQRRIDLRLAIAYPLLVSPIEASNCSGASIMAIIAQDQLSGDTSHTRIFKVAN